METQRGMMDHIDDELLTVNVYNGVEVKSLEGIKGLNVRYRLEFAPKVIQEMGCGSYRYGNEVFCISSGRKLDDDHIYFVKDSEGMGEIQNETIKNQSRYED